MSMHRYSDFLNTVPEPVPCKRGEWVIDEQYIIDYRGRAIVQWGSYTTRKNAKLIVLAKRFEKELLALAAKPEGP
jgi:hypothetical protein